MTSELNISDFQTQLDNTTKIGDPSTKGTPFAILTILESSKKSFYGKFDKKCFELTKNAKLFPIPYIISGNFKSTDDSRTTVDFKIKPIWFGYLWVRIIPFVGIILFNYLIITKTDVLPTDLLIVVNAFLSLMFLPIFILNYKKKKMDREFREVFKITD